jgi:hypothetical protein
VAHEERCRLSSGKAGARCERRSNRRSELRSGDGDPLLLGPCPRDVIGCRNVDGRYFDQVALDLKGSPQLVLGAWLARADLDSESADVPRMVVGQRRRGTKLPVPRAGLAVVVQGV